MSPEPQVCYCRGATRCFKLHSRLHSETAARADHAASPGSGYTLPFDLPTFLIIPLGITAGAVF